MFGIGLPELIIIIVVALLVVGPSQLPELARSMGRALGEFRRMADDVKDTIEQEMTKPLEIVWECVLHDHVSERLKGPTVVGIQTAGSDGDCGSTIRQGKEASLYWPQLVLELG